MSSIERKAKVLRKESWGDYYRLRILAPQIASKAKPGQFIMIKIMESYLPLLRRPFSLHSCSEDMIEIFFKVVGQGTAQLASKLEGQDLDIIGPLGRGFSLPESPQENLSLLVAGGRGIAPFP
ncbi:MAG: dihydroorotate dehydrogenase electron transfer subunit, partial [Candidatus Aminicenantes bacterium]|nr:dihydroorotate dehydrogenase electron transfer subunit [Candidatus Aminicenantes bacterium]